LEIDPSSTETKTFALPAYDASPCAGSVPFDRQLTIESFTDFSLLHHVIDSTLQTTLPSFIQYSDSEGTFSITITDPNTTGEYNLRVIATEPNSGAINTEVVFKLTLTCTITQFFNTAKGVGNINYMITADLSSKRYSVPLPTFATEPPYCMLLPLEVKLI
jgi:hypothetical protein